MNWWRVAIAVAAGLTALVVLFPASGNSRQPPECYSIFGYVVPCGAEVAVVVGLLAVGAFGWVLWRLDRSHRA